MPAIITVYGGVNEIGGNKVLIEDKNTRIIIPEQGKAIKF